MVPEPLTRDLWCIHMKYGRLAYSGGSHVIIFHLKIPSCQVDRTLLLHVQGAFVGMFESGDMCVPGKACEDPQTALHPGSCLLSPLV